MAITVRSENRSSGIVDLEQVSENDRSGSALVIGRVQAMAKRRWMFWKASSFQAPSTNKKLFGSSLSFDSQSVCI